MFECLKQCEQNLMPTVLLIKGWRVFFFANERNEPIHVHCKKGNAIAKFWIDTEIYDISKVYVRHMTRQEEREIREILFDHFYEIVEAWKTFKEKSDDR